jgi:DNA-binding NtrC family response regulator
MKERILVQDDEEPILEIMCSMLTASGYECLQAISPKNAWTILEAEKEVDVVLCGLIESFEEELVECITKTFPDIPVVVVSAFDDSSVVGVALRPGAYDFLKKPFGREQMLAVVRRALEYRRLKLENRALRGEASKVEDEKVTIDERIDKLKNITNEAEAIMGYLDSVQHPKPEQQVDTADCINKAHKQAEHALRHAQELIRDAWPERGAPTRCQLS